MVVHVYSLIQLPFIQELNVSCQFKHLKLDKHGDSPLSIGGNLHNEFVNYSEKISLYGGVIAKNIKLCNIGDYIAYCGEDEVQMQLTLISLRFYHMLCHRSSLDSYSLASRSFIRLKVTVWSKSCFQYLLVPQRS